MFNKISIDQVKKQLESKRVQEMWDTVEGVPEVDGFVVDPMLEKSKEEAIARLSSSSDFGENKKMREVAAGISEAIDYPHAFEEKKVAGGNGGGDADVRMEDVRKLTSTTATFSGILAQICRYAASNYVEDNSKYLHLISGDYDQSPSVIEIGVDLGKTKTVLNDFKAIYEDYVIAGSPDPYSDRYYLTCYAGDKRSSKELLAKIEGRMRSDNQYRGKCLFYGSKGFDYRDNPGVHWEDVVLTDNSRTEIVRNTVGFINNPELRKRGMNRRGLILHGPPGTGKTMVVKSIFSSLKDDKVTRIYATAETFAYPEDVGNLFDFLSYAGPTVLAFEDMDLISPDRNESQGRRILGSLLNNLDGLRSIDDPLVVIGTTNDVSLLDAALANRPSRFDRRIEVGLPRGEQILKFYEKMSGAIVPDDLRELLLSNSNGFSGAHIKEAVNTAILLSIESQQDVSKCLVSAAEIVRENFGGSLVKEASNKLYKHSDLKIMKKQGQVYLIPINDLNSIPFDLNMFQSLDYSNRVTDKDATSLWRLWNAQGNNVEDNKLTASGIADNDLKHLENRGIVNTLGNSDISLTSKGKKLLRSLILTQEVSPLDTKEEEKNFVSIDEMNRKIHGSSKKKSKMKTSSSDNKKVKVDGDWFYNSVKDIV